MLNLIIPVRRIGLGGQWVTTIQQRTPTEIEQGKPVKVIVQVRNLSQYNGRFRLLGTLGKFAPEDLAPTGPLYPPGGDTKFYWGAGQTPNPGNIAIFGSGGVRRPEFYVAAGGTVMLTFTSDALKPITAWDGSKVTTLDAHWVLEVWNVETQQFETEHQLADISCVRIKEVAVAQARGQIMTTTYQIA